MVFEPGVLLGKRTDGLSAPGDDFTGMVPSNIDTNPGDDPLLDGGGTRLFSGLNVDTEALGAAAGIDLSGDNFDWAFNFQFYDGDGAFSFTENFDDKVQINITPITGPTDLTPRGAAGPTHQDTSWNTRTYADYAFGTGGWFDAEIILTEDGGGAQSAAGIGFGYLNSASTDQDFNFDGIGYDFNDDPARQAVFDQDPETGLRWGATIVPEPSTSVIALLGGALLFFRRRR